MKRDNLGRVSRSLRRGLKLEALEPRILLNADLAIEALSAPDAAAWGDSFTASWRVTNVGDQPAGAGWAWNDVLIVSNTPDFAFGWWNPSSGSEEIFVVQQNYTSDNPLGPGEYYDYEATFDLGFIEGGDRYLLFVTDAWDNIVDADFSNNVAAQAISLAAPDIDLAVTGANAPATGMVGDSIDVSWTVKNNGSLAAEGQWGGWSDAVYLSRDEALDAGGHHGEGEEDAFDIWVDSRQANEHAPLAPGADYTLEAGIRIPNVEPGDWYLLFVADEGFEQVETNKANNVHAVPIVLGAPDTDLALTSLTVPQTGLLGDSIEVTYTVKNLGSETASADWNDIFYLSPVAGRSENERHLTSHNPADNTPLAPGASYTATVSISLPSQASPGDQYLVAVVDGWDDQYDTNPDNDTLAQPISVQAPDVDLVVASVDVPAQTTPGANFAIEWTVENQGGDRAGASYWHDYVYISPNAEFDDSATYIAYYYRSGGLDAGASYSAVRSYTLPAGVSGQQYIHVRTDIHNFQPETDATNNVRSEPIMVGVPDLAVTDATAPASVAWGEIVTVNWTVANSGDFATTAGWWYDAVYLSADNQLDAADATLATRYTSGVQPLGAGESYQASQNVTIPSSAGTGQMYLLFVADSTDRQGELSEANNLRAVPITVGAPDLVVTDAALPDTMLPGGNAELQWTIANQGDGAATRVWYDYVFLSEDSVLDASDTSLHIGNSASHVPLAPGEEYVSTKTVSLPASASGEMYLLFAADRTNLQIESNENNNVLAVAVQFDEVDLTVTNAAAPESATLGQTIEVSWTVRNDGSAAAQSDWTDRVYLSDQAELGDGAAQLAQVSAAAHTPLAAGAEYTLTASVFLPSGGAGERFLIFVADTYNQQPENDTANNARAVAITLNGPDLAVTDATAPDAAGWGETVQVSWTVANQGGGPALGEWSDRVYLSGSQELDGSAAYLGSFSAAAHSPLGAGENYTLNASVELSGTRVGQNYLLFVADASNQQAETDDANNVRALPIHLAGPDLAPVSATAPEAGVPGQTIAVEWTVANQGDGAAAANWTDRVYLSQDGELDASDILLASRFVSGIQPLAAGAEYTRSASVILPAADAGSWRLLFVADAGDTQSETDEANNVHALPIQLSAANLAIAEASAPESASWGEYASFSWTVVNNGDGGAFATWTDRVYLSPTDTLGADAVQIAYRNVTAPKPLEPGQSYSFDVLAKIPEGLSGDLHWLFVADAAGAQPEANEGDNLLALPVRVDRPDVAVTAATAPDSMVAGQFATFSWTVENQGDGAAWGNWYDRIYISASETFDETAVLAGYAYTGVNTPLLPGGSYTVETQAKLPGSAPLGQAYVHFVADVATGTQPDADLSNNVATRAVTVSAVDLDLAGAQAPASGAWGETFAIEWTVRNAGNGPVEGSWYDRVYFSSDEAFDAGDTYLLDHWVRLDQPLAPGGEYTVQRDLRLWTPPRGDGYLLFIADSGQTVHETDEINNVRAVPFSIRAADLAAAVSQAPQDALFGGTATIAWEVTNVGDGPTQQAWRDRLYLSSSADSLVGAISLGSWDSPSESTPLAAGESYVREVSVALPLAATLQAGEYYFVVVTDSQSRIQEPNEANNTVASAVQMALPVLPDLAVTDISVPQGAQAGQAMEVQWTVANQGAAAASGTWTDRVYLSGDAAIGSDRHVATFSFTGAIEAGQQIVRTQAFVLPADIAGDQWVVVHTDWGNAVFEHTSTQNNLAVSAAPVHVDSFYPNLVVEAVVAPAEAYSDQQTTVEWTVTNTGNAPTSAPVWYDSVYLSLDDQRDASDIFLGSAANISHLNPGESYVSSLTVNLPTGVHGDFRFLVTADTNNHVQEFAGEGDNTTASVPVAVQLTPPPDLRVASVTAPAQAFAGEPVAIAWTVTNAGENATIATGWYDDIYLSEDDQLDGADRYLGRFHRRGRLDPGATYSVSREVALPEGLGGSFHFIVLTDSFNHVFEHVYDQNNATAAAAQTTVHVPPPPDLEVVSVSVPPEALAGNSVTVDYEVHNYGSVQTRATWWTDAFYLAESPDQDPAEALLLGTVRRVGALDADAGYAASASFSLPTGIEGQRHILVLADRDGGVREIDTDNNLAASAAFDIANRPPNLVVADLSAPAEGLAGGALTVRYTVANQGTGPAPAGNWVDRIYLSSDDQLGGDSLLAIVNRQGPLAAGSAYDVSASIELPATAEGDYWLFVVADAQSNVYEGGADGDNASGPVALRVERRLADLAARDVSAPAVVASGEGLAVEWTVTNQGEGATGQAWYDWILLAPAEGDPIFLASVRRNGALAPGESYTAQHTVAVPVDMEGEYTVRVVADAYATVADADRPNNAADAAASTAIQLSPVPDLAVTRVTPPAEAMTGERVSVSWTVANLGAATGETRWDDAVYLSRDMYFDRGADIYLGFASRATGLGAGESYDQTLEVAMPAGLSGPFYFVVVADSRDRVHERGATQNNTLAADQAVSVALAPPADLVAGTVVVPESAALGGELSLSYTVSNQGLNAAVGSWQDALYLSSDEAWDVGDKLLARLPVAGPLAPGGEYTREISVALPGVAPGLYHVIVRSDIQNRIPETSAENNLAASIDRADVDVPVLELDQPVLGELPQGRGVWFRVDAPAGQTMRFSLQGESAQSVNELYVSYGEVPTRGTFDFRHTQQLSADVEIVVPTTQGGVYYVMAYNASSPAAERGYTLAAELIPFSVRSAGPGTLGNAGAGTLLLRGAHFDRDTAFRLIAPGGGVVEPTRVMVANASAAYATFDLSGRPTGFYHVEAELPDRGVHRLEDGLEVVVGSGPRFQAEVSGQMLVAPGREYIFNIVYGNVGDADVVAPLLIVHSPTGTPFGFSADDLDGDRALWIMAKGLEGPAGTLRPGDLYSVPLVHFSTAAAMSFEVQAVFPEDPSPLDWSEMFAWLDENMAPEGVSAQRWSAAKARFRETVGETWGDFAGMLARNATLVPPEDAARYDVGAIVRVELQRALAASGASISGTARSADLGVDLSGRAIAAVRLADGESWHTVSLSDGSFVFSDIEPGEYEFRFQGAVVAGDPTVAVGENQAVSGVVIDLVAGAEIAGRVSARESGAPLAGANVVLASADGFSWTVAADGQGSYRHEGVPVGEYQLFVVVDGRAAMVESVSVPDAEAIALNLAVAAPGSVAGQAVANGAAPGATLHATAELADALGLFSTFYFTGPAPEFRLDGLPAGVYNVEVSMPGWVPFTIEGVEVEAGATASVGTVELARGASATGRVQSFDDRVDASSVSLGLYGDGGLVTITLPEAGGEFMFVDFLPGDYTVSVVGLADWPSDTWSFSLVAGETVEDGLIRIAPGAVLSGEVRLADGAPAPGARVLLLDGQGVAATTLADEDGSYSFHGLGLGQYTARLDASGQASSASVVVDDMFDGRYTANLTLAHAASVGGRVLNVGGAAPEAAEALLFRDGKLVASAEVDEQGGYEFLLAAPGDYHVTALADGMSFGLAAFTVADGQASAVDLSPGSRSLSVGVADGAAPEADALVVLLQRLSDGDYRAVASARTDAAGAAEFENLADGSYRVMVRTDGKVALASVEIAGANATAQASLEQSLALAGRVLDELGAPIPDAVVFALPHDAAAPVMVGVADADGYFAIEGLAAGTYDVVAMADGYAAVVQADAQAGTDGLELVLAESDTEIVGVVRDADGAPLAEATVQALDEAGRLVGLARTGADGSFSIRGAQGAGLTVVVSAPGFETAALADVAVAAGATADVGPVELAFVAAGRFTGDASGRIGDQREAPAQSDGWTYASPGAPGWLRSLLVSPKRYSFEPDVWNLPIKRCEAGRNAYRALVGQSRDVDAKWETVKDMGDTLYSLAWQRMVLYPRSLAVASGRIAQMGLILVGIKAAIAGSAVAAPAWMTVGVKVKLANILTGAASLGKTAWDAVSGSTDLDGAINKLHAVSTGSQGITALIDDVLDFARAMGNTQGGSAGFSAGLGMFGMLLDLKNVIKDVSFADIRDELQTVKSVRDVYERSHEAYTDSVRKAVILQNQFLAITCAPPPPPGPQPVFRKPGEDGDPTWNPPGQWPVHHNPRPLISKDPNDILGPDGYGDENWVRADQTLGYTIRFENDPELATAPAQEVVITHQLDASLDWRTFRLGNMGFGETTVEVPANSAFFTTRLDLSEDTGFWVDVFAFIDVTTGQATWTLTTLDPATSDKPLDPTLGFLPVNDENGIGEGFVTYSVRARRDAQTGDEVHAEARIVFDINEPIDTPPIFHTLDADAPASAVDALPSAQSESDFLVRWAGSDGEGAGVATYTVYASEDDGEFYPWLQDTELTEAMFSGRVGGRYAFYSVATDHVGHAEGAGVAADTQTRVGGAQNPPVAGDMAFTVEEGAAHTGQLAGSDLDGDSLAYTVVLDPTLGDLVVQSDGSFTYTAHVQPAAEFTGADSFTYRVNDGAVDSEVGVVTVTISQVFSAYDLNQDGYIGQEDYALFAAAWRSRPDDAHWNPAADFDGNGFVGMGDYSFFTAAWQKDGNDPSIVYPATQAAGVSSATGSSEGSDAEPVEAFGVLSSTGASASPAPRLLSGDSLGRLGGGAFSAAGRSFRSQGPVFRAPKLAVAQAAARLAEGGTIVGGEAGGDSLSAAAGRLRWRSLWNGRKAGADGSLTSGREESATA